MQTEETTSPEESTSDLNTFAYAIGVVAATSFVLATAVRLRKRIKEDKKLAAEGQEILSKLDNTEA